MSGMKKLQETMLHNSLAHFGYHGQAALLLGGVQYAEHGARNRLPVWFPHLGRSRIEFNAEVDLGNWTDPPVCPTKQAKQNKCIIHKGRIVLCLTSWTCLSQMSCCSRSAFTKATCIRYALSRQFPGYVIPSCALLCRVGQWITM